MLPRLELGLLYEILISEAPLSVAIRMANIQIEERRERILFQTYSVVFNILLTIYSHLIGTCYLSSHCKRTERAFTSQSTIA
jgi:hypothetical protein